MATRETHVLRRRSSKPARIRSGKLKISGPIQNSESFDNVVNAEHPPLPPFPVSPGANAFATVTPGSERARTPVSPLQHHAPLQERIVSQISNYENAVSRQQGSQSFTHFTEWERQTRPDASTVGIRTRPSSQAHLFTPHQQTARNSRSGFVNQGSNTNTPSGMDTAQKKKQHGRTSLRFALRKFLGLKSRGEDARFTPVKHGIQPGVSAPYCG